MLISILMLHKEPLEFLQFAGQVGQVQSNVGLRAEKKMIDLPDPKDACVKCPSPGTEYMKILVGSLSRHSTAEIHPRRHGNAKYCRPKSGQGGMFLGCKPK